MTCPQERSELRIQPARNRTAAYLSVCFLVRRCGVVPVTCLGGVLLDVLSVSSRVSYRVSYRVSPAAQPPGTFGPEETPRLLRHLSKWHAGESQLRRWRGRTLSRCPWPIAARMLPRNIDWRGHRRRSGSLRGVEKTQPKAVLAAHCQRSMPQLHPLVPPHVSHLRQVPLRSNVKFPHSRQLSPSYPLIFA